MGNSISNDSSSEDTIAIQQIDNDFIALQLDVLFNASYLSSISAKLPVYPGSEIQPDTSTENSWNYLAWQLKNLFSDFQDDVVIEDFEVSQLISCFISLFSLISQLIISHLLSRTYCLIESVV